jgi:hypothetical protein
MAKAAFEFGSNGMRWVAYKKACPNIAKYKIQRQRAALHALAEMVFSSSVIFSSRGAYDGDDWDEGVRIVTRAVLLAAAEEGEK